MNEVTWIYKINSKKGVVMLLIVIQ